MQSLFVMDPLHRIQVSGDSTYMLMRELTDRNMPVWMCTPGELDARDGCGFARAARVITTREAPYFEVVATEERELGAFDVVWMRKDPPFDMSYILATYILDMAPRGTLVVNDPAGLKLYNEKIWAMQFPEIHPATLLSSDASRIRTFVASQGRAVLKPWDGNGGRGVLVTAAGDRNLNSMIELLTRDGEEKILVQAFVEGADRGDKRILLFDGEPVGQMLRVPTAEDYRGNMHVGARVVGCDLDARDVEICRILGPRLEELGMIFVGIDVISGLLTEINVTSPTGIQEINQLFGLRLEATLIDLVGRRLEARRESL